MPCSPTFCEPCARHLEPPLLLSLTHGIFSPQSCHSNTRLTADIIKAAGPPDTLLAQSRNANRHRATWALAQNMPSMDNSVDWMICFFFLFSQTLSSISRLKVINNRKDFFLKNGIGVFQSFIRLLSDWVVIPD